MSEVFEVGKRYHIYPNDNEHSFICDVLVIKKLNDYYLIEANVIEGNVNTAIKGHTTFYYETLEVKGLNKEIKDKSDYLFAKMDIDGEKEDDSNQYQYTNSTATSQFYP